MQLFEDKENVRAKVLSFAGLENSQRITVELH
jgi:hypothetical protein